MRKREIILHLGLSFLLVPLLGIILIEGMHVLGLKKLSVPVVGTGSMYPSLFWSKEEGGPEDQTQQLIEEYRATPSLYRRFSGININGHHLLKRTIQFGDIVAFRNAKTDQVLLESGRDKNSGYIKRVIGVPGDMLELRDGFVYKNTQLLLEPYIYSPRSTYGGESLPDCTNLTVPAGKYFVLGDNRKISSDSRFELGLIDEVDIQFILPYEEQERFRSLWRDPAKDQNLLGQSTLDIQDFLVKINAIRQKNGVGKLTLNSALTKSSGYRAKHLLKDGKDTSYTVADSLAAANYSNIIYGEFSSQGHYNASELVANLLNHSQTAKQILGKDFQDFGITVYNQEINGCPKQIIVGHLGGYIPPNYASSDLKSWYSLRDNLKEVIPSWEQAKSYNNLDQVKLQNLLAILSKRLALTESIIATMEKNLWFSEEQNKAIKQDQLDAKESERLITELNKQ